MARELGITDRRDERCPLCGRWHATPLELARHLLFNHNPQECRTLPLFAGSSGPRRGDPDIITCWCGWETNYRHAWRQRTVAVWAEHLLFAGGISEHWLLYALGLGGPWSG